MPDREMNLFFWGGEPFPNPFYAIFSIKWISNVKFWLFNHITTCYFLPFLNYNPAKLNLA